MKTTSRFLLLALAAGISTASAGPWEDYQAAFPAFPCQDGWMACVQDGNVIDPDLQPDGTGMLNPADARIGWFDLQATNNFNPFPELSKYPGKEPRRKGDAAVADAGSDANGGDAGGDDPDANGNTNTNGGGDANDGSAMVEPEYVDPAAEMARKEEDEAKIAEAEARARSEKAAEEEKRAKEEEAARMKAAEEKARQAEKALAEARKAQDAAEKQRLEEEARRAKEAEERARKQADEAAALRAQREREAEERRKAEEKARAEREKAEADRKKKEEAERAAAEKSRKEEEARKAAAAAEADRKAEEARKAAAAEELKKAQEAQKRAQELAAQAKAAADDAERARLEAERKKAEEAEKKAKEEADRKAAEAAKAAKEESERKAREEEERRKAEEAERKKAEMQRLEAEKAAKEGNTAEANAAVSGGGDDGTCEDLVALETTAILGKLTDGTVQCLEGQLAAAERMTQKSKISRILMINAFTAGKREQWATLMKRHLNEIEQSDPELCYKYALHLSRLGPSSAYGVIKWSNTALENRMIWTGSTYESRVYSLYKIRATAAHKIWIDLENKHAADPTEESSQKTKQARNRTKEFAREWLEYAKAAGKPTDKALDLCMSAAGTKDYCEAG